MNKVVARTLAILRALNTYYISNKAKIDEIINLKELYESLFVLIPVIEDLMPIQHHDHTKTTALKRQKKAAMASNLVKIMNLVYVYLLNHDGQELAKDFKMVQSDLTRKRDKSLLTYADNKLRYLKGLSAEKLTEMGITAEMISSFEEARQAYEDYCSKPQEIIEIGKQAGMKIQKELDKMPPIVEQIDCLMFSLFGEEEPMYTNYKNCYKQKIGASKKRALAGSVMEEGTNTIPKRAHIIIGNANIDQIVTSKKGNFVVNHLPPGVYVVEIVCKNYESQLHTISHVAGETNRLDVKLKRVREVEEVTS
jgi:hypothetical protein